MKGNIKPIYISVIDSSLKSNPSLQIVRSNEIYEGETLWNDSNHTIEELPVFLRGSTLFKLPKNNVKKGVCLTMTCPMKSDIYIAHKRRKESVMNRCCRGVKYPEYRALASDVFDLEVQEGWASISGEIIYGCDRNLPCPCLGGCSKRSRLTNLLHHHNSSNTTIDLPRPKLDGTFAIFLVEGNLSWLNEYPFNQQKY